MTRTHTDSSYDKELGEINERLLLMGAKVEDMVAGAIRSYLERDSRLARDVIDADRDIDSLEVDIDERCLRVLALRKPVASDLRFVTAAMKLVTNLERVGDLAETISRRAIDLNAELPMTAVPPLQKLALTAPGMLRSALDAFSVRDAWAASTLFERDRALDVAYAQCFPELMCLMIEDAKNVATASRLQSIATSLERIGDHATNIAEIVVFMVAGRDVRRSDPEASAAFAKQDN